VTADRDDARVLDEEGLPDFEGPLPEKAATGDPQEGLPPPSDRPASFDWGVTAAEAAEGESIATRVAHERPDFDEPYAVRADDADRGIEDVEDELVADASSDEPSRSAEEEAVHVVAEAPGAVDREDDGYLT